MRLALVKCVLDSGGPYKVWKAPKAGFTVIDKNGYNVMRFPEEPGKVFSTYYIAQHNCNVWNGEDLI